MRLEVTDHAGISQTKADDPRVTRLGRFLRRTSLDELPQLLNVLAGHMSLVGPRPHIRGMKAEGVVIEDLMPHYNQRLLVRPGITGWAQANGFRGETRAAADAIRRVEHDLAYIANYSVILDLAILVQTMRREFITGTGV